MTTTYLLDTATPLTMVLAEQTGTDPAITYLHGLDLVAQSDGATTEYFAYDGLGSVRQVADAAGSPLLAQTFDPYGSLYARAGIAETAWGFTGAQTDANGLLYLRARYYAPSQGRFFQLDPSRQEVNPYAYVAGNPLRYSDPSGLICVDGVDKWPYHVAPCASGWDFGESAWSEASSQLQAFSNYLFTQGGAALIPYIAGMELGGNFILRQHRLMNYDRYYAGAEGGDIAYAEDFFTQLEAAGRFELAAMQVADVATPLSELGLASRAMSCGDDVMRVVIIEALDGDGYYDDLGRRIEQTLVDGDSLTWQYDFQPMAQYGAPNIRMQLSSSRAIAPIDKFRHYIFKPGATHGKDRVFRSLGYGAEDSALLARIYEEQAWTNFQQGKYSLGRLDQYGQRINIEIILEGVGEASGKRSYLQTGWMLHEDGSITLNTPFTGFTR